MGLWIWDALAVRALWPWTTSMGRNIGVPVGELGYSYGRFLTSWTPYGHYLWEFIAPA